MRPKAEDGLRTVGYELVAEFMPSPDAFTQDDRVIDHMREAALMADLTVRTSLTHHFDPIGVTATVILAESHATVSTWPEFGYMAIDVYSCTTPQSCVRFLQEFCAFYGEGDLRGLMIRRPFSTMMLDVRSWRGLEDAKKVAHALKPQEGL